MKKGWTGFALLLVLLSQAHGQEIWQQADGQGHVRYADRPFPGAVRIQSPGTAGWRSRAGPPPSKAAQGEAQAATQAAALGLEIASPAAGETVWGAGGGLEVRLLVNGELEGGAGLSILLDGAEASWQGELPVLRLAEVWRGEHRLRARVLDARGRELAASEEVRFFKREPAIPEP